MQNKMRLTVGGEQVSNGHVPRAAGRYRCLVVDPPWPQRKTGRRSVRPQQGVDLDYPTMSFDDIRSLPIREWAAQNAYLWLWATNSKDRKSGVPILKTAFEVMEAWGFRYYTTLTWDKKTGPCPFGPYQITTEHVLFGYCGKAVFPRGSWGRMKTMFQESAKAHSVKPDALYRHIKTHFTGPRLDVFARAGRDGFDGWGDEYRP